MKNKVRSHLGSYVSSSARMVPSARLWPNGEFSLGYARVGEEGAPEGEWRWTGGDKGLTESELDDRLECLAGWLDCVDQVYSVSGQLALRLLTLSSVPNSHKGNRPAKNGLQGMTGFGMKMVRSGCYLLEKKLGKDDCVMVTLTVPTLGRSDRQKLAQQWGQVTNRLVQYLSRALVKSGRPPAIIGCVEIQTARLEKYRQAYLHLHLVCPAHSNTGGVWAVKVEELVSWWQACLERTIGKELPHAPRVETAIVEKSVEAYLAKYLSKGSGEELAGFIADLGESAVPGQWWLASASMRAAIKSRTVSGRNAGAIIDALVNNLLEDSDGRGFEYIRHIDCLFGGRPITVGYVGRLSPELTADVLAMMHPG